MKSPATRIVILDDNSFDNTLCVLYFKKMFHLIDYDILGFTDPQEGLQYMETEFAEHPVQTILFLDISMPVLNGWDVLKVLEQLPEDVTQYLTVYILSNSIHEDDVQKSEASPLVKAYLTKPLTDHLAYLFEEIVEGRLVVRAQ